MTATDTVLELTIEQGGLTYRREFRKADAKGNAIIFGRLSSSAPDEGKVLSEDQLTGVGGFITSRGRAAFLSPVMSRKHAEITFTDDGVSISDLEGFSHHGTFIRRDLVNMRVTAPVLLRTGDIITFGKAVHRGGETFQPLKAEVKLLPGNVAPGLFSFPSFTGHGYSLPPAIDDDCGDDFEEDNDVYKDDAEEYEHPATHKHYAEQEIIDDDDQLQSPIVTTIPSYMTPAQFMAGQYNPPPPALSFPQPSPWRLLYNFAEPPAPVQPRLEPSYLPHMSAQSHQPSYSHVPVWRAPSPPPTLPPIIRKAAVEVIDVDAAPDSLIIDVDALESDDGASHSDRHASVISDSEDASGSEEGSEIDYSEEAAPPSPKLASRSPSPRPREAVGEAQRNLIENVKELSQKIDGYMDKSRETRQNYALNKLEIEAKLASFQAALEDIKAKNVEAVTTENNLKDELDRQKAEVEKLKAEALEDIESRKRSFLADLDIFEDDVTYDVDRVGETVEDVEKEVEKARKKLEELVQRAERLSVDAETRIRTSIENVETASKAAVDNINEAVTSFKRKRQELDEAERELAERRVVTPPLVEAPASEPMDAELVEEVCQDPAPSPSKRRCFGLYTAALTAGVTYYALGRF